MRVTEQQRHQLFVWFEEHMGQERAATMMELIPPAGADELATKRDLNEALGALDRRMDLKLEQLRSDLQRTLGTWIFASQAAVIAAVGVFTAIS